MASQGILTNYVSINDKSKQVPKHLRFSSNYQYLSMNGFFMIGGGFQFYKMGKILCEFQRYRDDEKLVVFHFCSLTKKQQLNIVVNRYLMFDGEPPRHPEADNLHTDHATTNSEGTSYVRTRHGELIITVKENAIKTLNDHHFYIWIEAEEAYSTRSVHILVTIPKDDEQIKAELIQ